MDQRIAVLLLVCGLGGLAADPAIAQPLDRSRYLSELARARDAFAGDVSLAQARQAAAALPNEWHVEQDGRTIVADVSWIDAEVGTAGDASWPSRRETIRRRLATMHAEAMQDGADGGATPRTVLGGILARPEFQRSVASAWLQRQRERVGRWLLDVFNRFSRGPVRGRTVAMILAWTVSLIALIVLALWLVSMLTRRSRAAALDLGAAAPPRPPAREWARRAMAALKAGDVREAVRCGYSAAICRLEEQGVWAVDDSRTPREYVRLLRREDPRTAPVADVAGQFEQIWYGRRATSGDDAQRLSANLERLGCVHAADRTI